MTLTIDKILNSQNIAADISDEELEKISHDVFIGYDIDKESRSEWEKTMQSAMKLARQIYEIKNFPIEKAANIKYPLLATAAIQFSARAYPNFVNGTEIVKMKIIGKDPDGLKAGKANRIRTHMSYQVFTEMEEWEEETDKALTILPLTGCVFKKIWFSPVLKRNVSEYRSPEVIVINYHAKSMKKAPRISEVYTLYPNDIETRKRQKLFLDIDYDFHSSTEAEKTSMSNENKDKDITSDPYSPKLFIEQHTYLDLDGDGYMEPYIIHGCYDSKKIARIVANFEYEDIVFGDDGKIVSIEPTQYYVKFPFMPSFDGSIYDTGFGQLLTPINEVIDTNINQLLDSGTMHNAQSGFIGGGLQLGRGRGGGGNIKFNINEWKSVSYSGDDIKKNIFPLPTKPPSPVLFNLLGFMVTAGEKMSTVTDIFTGGSGGNNEKATTTLARVENGLKMFGAIHKRLYRAFKTEFKLLFMLNKKYAVESQTIANVLDEPIEVYRSDYDETSCDVVPVADPNDISSTQKRVKAEILMNMKGQGLNDNEINKRMLEAIEIQDVEKILEAPKQQPPIEYILGIEQMKLEWAKFQFEVSKFGVENKLSDSTAMKNMANAIESLAKAEATEVGPQLEIYKAQLSSMASMMPKNKEGSDGNNKAGISDMEATQGNEGSL